MLSDESSHALLLDKALAPKHPNTLFLRTSVEDVPFLVTRLGVKVLPCVISFVNGNAIDRSVVSICSRDDICVAKQDYINNICTTGSSALRNSGTTTPSPLRHWNFD